MKKNKFILLLMSVFLSFPAIAQIGSSSINILPTDSLTIRKIGLNNAVDKSVNIDGKNITIGEVVVAGCILSGQKTGWSLNINYIEVRNGRTGEIIVINRNEQTHFRESMKYLYQEYIKKPRTGTKGSNRNECIRDMNRWLSQTFYIFDDYLIMSSSLLIDYNHTYILTPVNKQGSKIKLLYDPKEPFLMYISSDSLEQIGVNIENNPCTFRVEYLDIDDDICIYITDEFRVEKY